MRRVRFALPFALIALASAAFSTRIPLAPALLAVWCALAFGLGALAYAGVGPGLFGKRAEGTLRGANVLAMLPLHLTTWLSAALQRALSNENPVDEIRPGLFLGRRLQAREARLVGEAAVVDLTCELGEVLDLRTGRPYLCLPTLDGTPPSQTQLDEAIEFMAAHRERGLFVHCALGHGRSATVVAAWLVEIEEAEELAEAEFHLRAARPGVHLHATQRAAAQQWVSRG